MTAEVAILNKQSVALAADSAVTTGELKIFNTVNKLFALSKHQPVGIMAYNNSEVMGIPTETVIKEFRRLRGTTKREHLEEYAQDFEDFLQTDALLFSDDARGDSLCALAWTVVMAIKQESFRRLGKLSGWGHPTEKEGKDILSEVLAEMEVYLKSQSVLGNPRKNKSLMATAIDETLNTAMEWLRQALPVDATREKKTRRLIIDHFFRDIGSGNETGLVISGFGTRDVFPRLRAFEFCYSALGLHKVRMREEIDIGPNRPSQIMPFGQRDVMATFVEGIDPRY